MRKVVITYGLISGAIISAFLLLSMYLWGKGEVVLKGGTRVLLRFYSFG